MSGLHGQQFYTRKNSKETSTNFRIIPLYSEIIAYQIIPHSESSENLWFSYDFRENRSWTLKAKFGVDTLDAFPYSAKIAIEFWKTLKWMET